MAKKVLIIVTGMPHAGKTSIAAEIVIGLIQNGLKVETFGHQLQELLAEKYCHGDSSLLAVAGKVRRYDCDVAILDTTEVQRLELESLSSEDLKYLEDDGIILMPVLLLGTSEASVNFTNYLAAMLQSDIVTPIVLPRLVASRNVLQYPPVSCIYCRVSEFPTGLMTQAGRAPFVVSDWAYLCEDNFMRVADQVAEAEALVNTLCKQISLISNVSSLVEV